MRGGFLRISAELLFESFGVNRGDLEVTGAMMDPDYPGVVRLFLTGSDKRLPTIKKGERYKEMEVIMTLGKATTRPTVSGKLMTIEKYRRDKERRKA